MLSLKSVWKRDVKGRAKNENDSGFTVITVQKATEVKASGNPHTHLGNTLTAHTHKPVAQTITPATHTSGETDLNERGAKGTAMTSSNGDEDSMTSSDQGQAGGTLIHFDYNQLNVLCMTKVFLLSKNKISANIGQRDGQFSFLYRPV